MKYFVVVLLVLVADGAVANAQLFGQRNLGRPLSRASRAGATISELNTDAGQVTGTERFIRGNRDRASFVGADQSETQSFVGSQQASTSGVIVSSTAGIEPPPDRSDEINQAIEAPNEKKMYLPKVVLSAEFVAESRAVAARRVTQQLQRSMMSALQQPIEVLVEGESAILRGVVKSAKEKRLAETLVLFEPGIWKVDNRLVVRPDSSVEAPRPAR